MAHSKWQMTSGEAKSDQRYLLKSKKARYRISIEMPGALHLCSG